MVMQILLRTRYDETEKIGIRRLLNDGTYSASFPLHEGRYDKPHSSGSLFDRRVRLTNRFLDFFSINLCFLFCSYFI